MELPNSIFPGTKLLINLDIIGEKDVRESLPLNVSLISKAGARQAAEAANAQAAAAAAGGSYWSPTAWIQWAFQPEPELEPKAAGAAIVDDSTDRAV